MEQLPAQENPQQPDQPSQVAQSRIGQAQDYDNAFTVLVNKVNKNATDTEGLQEKVKEQNTLLFVGYFVMLVVVASMVVTTIALFIEVLKDFVK